MIDKLQQQIENLTQQHENRKRWLAILAVLAVMVVAATAYALVRPAITLENTTHCGLEEHTHTEACYASVATAETAASDQELTCGKEEHTHTLACYADPTADIENEEDWANSVAQAELTGNWGDDLANVAQSQLGYTASEKNYTVALDGETKQPYTRYGAWSGDAYTDWNLPFVNFCLHYAQIPAESFPVEADLSSLMEALTDDERNQFAPADGYVPQAGDVALLTNNGEDISAVGIVAELCAETDDQPAKVAVIEADDSNTVRRVEYALDDEKLLGYGVMLQNPDAGRTSEKSSTPEASLTAATETATLAAEDEIAVQAASNKTIVALSAVPKSDTIPAGAKLTQSMFTITATYSDGTTGVIPEPVTVTSPNWPNDYVNNMTEDEYNWTNTFPGVKAVEVAFDSDSYTEYRDKVRIYDKSGNMVKELSDTGLKGSRCLVSGDTAKITMSSDSSTTVKGFLAIVSASIQITPEIAPEEAGNFTVSLALLDKKGATIGISAETGLTVEQNGTVNGSCGENAQWSYSNDGTLTISGSGATNDYDMEPAPWNDYPVKKLVIEEGITKIGRKNFQDNEKLQFVTIPADIELLYGAFSGCTSIKELNVTGTVAQAMKSTPDRILEDCTGDIKVVLSDGIELPGYAFGSCEGLKSVKIEGNLKEIPYGAFYYCRKLERVELPESITKIGAHAFENCEKLKTVKIPTKVTEIGASAFIYCDQLDNIVLPEKLTKINSDTFNGCKNLKNITIPDGIELIDKYAFCGCTSLQSFPFEKLSKLKEIGSYAFNGCANITGVNFPDSLTSVHEYAFANTGLTSLTIPQNLGWVETGIVAGCKNFTELKWNVTNGSWYQNQAMFKNDPRLIVTVGKNVKALWGVTMKGLALCGAKVVRFEGPNWLEISNAAQPNGALPLGTLTDGTYYADENGALYRLEEDRAVLAYLPAEMTAYTVPTTVPANETGSKLLPVTAVGSHALYSAADLTALTFQSPKQINELADFAFAYAGNLSTINGAGTAQEVLGKFADPCKKGQLLFTGTKIGETGTATIQDTLHLSGLPDNKGDDTLDVTVRTTNSKNYPEPTAADRTKVYYTGEAAVTTLIISNPSSAEIENDDGAIVRLYMDFDGQGGKPQLAVGEYTIGVNSGTTYTYKVSQISGTNIYCFEVQRPRNGDTITLNLESGYASPTTGGGSNRIFGTILSKGDKENLQGNELPYIDQYQNLQWETKVDKFPVTKKCIDQNVMAKGDGNGHAYITGLAYEIDTPRKGDTLEGIGKDLMTSTDYTDVLTLPEGITIDEKALHAIQTNNYTWQVTFGDCVLYDQSDNSKLLRMYIREYNTMGFSMGNVETIGNNQLVLHFTFRNTTLGTSKPTEMSNQKFQVKFGDSLLYIDQPTAQKTYEINNKVTAVEHFSYSEDQTYTEECPYQFVCGEGTLKLQKTVKSGSSQMGDSRVYTITASNDAALPYTKLAFLDDEMPCTEYLSASDIEELFRNDSEAKQASVTIKYATICNVPVAAEVRDMDGTVAGKVSVGNTDTGTNANKYNGMNKSSDSTALTEFATITISWSPDEATPDLLRFTLHDTNDKINDRIASCALDTKEIQKLLDNWGYIVTYDAYYKVRWDLRETDGNFVLQGGRKISYDLKVTNKDTFMMLRTDQKYQYPSNSVYGRNDAYGRDADEERLAFGDASDYTYREFSLVKDAKINGQEIEKDSELLKDGAIIDYDLTVTHTSDAHYDVLPLTDHMSGAQILLAEVDSNQEADWTGDLTIVEDNNGTRYYKLDAERTYMGVWLDGNYADSVKVKNNNAGRDTLIKWYFSDYEGNRTDTIHYKAWLQLKGQVNGYYPVNNETWLGDHETHRLYNEVGWTRLDYTFDKKIVEDENDQGDGISYCPITEGETVTYRLKLQTFQDRTYTLTGADLYDELPSSLGAYKNFVWTKGNGVTPGTVNIIRYDCQGSGHVEGGDDWSITSDPYGSTRQYIRWGDSFSITFGPQPVYIYVQLTYPKGELWQAYAKECGTQILKNTFFVEGVPSTVTHALALPAKAYLQKGVWKTYGTVGSTKWIRNPSSSMSRWYYCNDDIMTRGICYYVLLRNDGETRLYLNDLQDTLPKGFTLQGMLDSDSPEYPYIDTSRKSIMTSGTVASYFVDTETADGTKVKYKTIGVSVSTQEDTATNTQKLSFHFTSVPFSYSYSVAQYDEDLGKCYLNPGEAIQFAYYCRTNSSADTENVATNTITMPYYDYANGGLSVGNNKQKVYNSDTYIPNDGSCKIWDNSTAAANGFTVTSGDLIMGDKNSTPWIESDVTVRRGEISPGITKKLAAKLSQNNVITENPLAAHPVDTLRWDVVAQNNGALPMIDFTLSDTMPSPYYFTGTVNYQLECKDNKGYATRGEAYLTKPSNDEKKGLFEIQKTEDPNVFQIASYMNDYSYTKKTLLKVDGEPIKIDTLWMVNGNGYYRCTATLEVSMTQDKTTGATTLWVRFTDPHMSLPEGGVATMTLDTKAPDKETWRNTVYTNSCNITPMVQPWDTSAVNQGNATTQTPMFDGKERPSVRNSAPVTVTYGYATTSLKMVEEVDDPTNKANSNNDRNFIVLPGRDSTFRYTLAVTNEDPTGSGQQSSMEELILIDSLPQKGDHTVFQTDDPRYSDFTVSLADKDEPVVTITAEDDTVTKLNSSQYRLEFSDKTEFDDSDWNGTSTWNTPAAQARSVRLVLKDPNAKDGENPLMPSGSTIAFSFVCKVNDQNDAAAGQIAWNSFGYHYTMPEQTPQEAAPLKVGVMLPTQPTLQKKLQLNGAPYAAEKDETFTFYCYTGQPLTDLPEHWTAAQLEAKLTEAHRDWRIIPVAVTAGDTASAVQQLTDTEKWTWQKNQVYTIVEVPNDRYTLAELNGIQQNTYTFTYDPARTVAITAVNTRDSWSFTLEKVDEDAPDTHLADAWFALYSKDDRDIMTDEAYAALTCKAERTITDGDTTWYLTQVGVTRADTGYLTFTGLTRDEYRCKEIKAPNGYAPDETLHKITREDNAKKICKITNKRAYRLPNTGGCGTTPFTVAGLLLIAAASCLLFKKYRRKQEGGTASSRF